MDFFAFPFVEDFIHLIVRFMSEALEGYKFVTILDISVLFVRSPSFEVIILKDERFWTAVLLTKVILTYLTKLDALYLMLWLARSLKSVSNMNYPNASADI